MNKKFTHQCLCFVLMLLSICLSSQESEEKKQNHFRISPVISHTYIPTATSAGTETIIVPSIGLDLEYWFGHKFGIGLHNDLELYNYEVEEFGHHSSIKREYPVVITLDGLVKVYKNLVLVAGIGAELEKHENLFLIRTGLEYEIVFAENWDLSPTILYDFRADEFGTWSIGVGVGRSF